MIIGEELTNKFTTQRTLLYEIDKLKDYINTKTSSLLFIAIICKCNQRVASKLDEISKRHDKKLTNLRTTKSTKEHNNSKDFCDKTIFNFSDYVLSNEEKVALSRGLDQHIPLKINSNEIQTQFEMFYQSVTKNCPPTTDDDMEELKTKLRSTCGRYERIKIPNENKDVIDNLIKNENIVI